MYRPRWVARIAMTLGPVAASAWIGACAADLGDPTKATPLSGTADGPVSSDEAGVDAGQGPDSSTPPPPPGDAMATADAMSVGDSPTLPPPTDSTSPVEASPLPEGAPPVDASPPIDAASPPDTGPVDTGPPPPPPADAGGCSAGSTLITASDPSGSGSVAGTTGNFGTTGAVCVKLMGGIPSMYGGWNSSNIDGRTVTLNGVTVPVGGAQGMVAAGPDGYAIWEWSAGTKMYASMSLY